MQQIDTMKELKYLNKYFRKYKYKVLLGVVIVACAKVFSLFTPQLIGDVVTLVANQIENPVSEDTFKATVSFKIILKLDPISNSGIDVSSLDFKLDHTVPKLIRKRETNA